MYFTPDSSQTFSKFQNEKLSNLGQTRRAFIGRRLGGRAQV